MNNDYNKVVNPKKFVERFSKTYKVLCNIPNSRWAYIWKNLKGKNNKRGVFTLLRLFWSSGDHGKSNAD